MPEERTCVYTGKSIEPGTGIMYVKANGEVLHFVDSKAEKNYLLGREPRDLEWTEAGGAGEAEAKLAAAAEEGADADQPGEPEEDADEESEADDESAPESSDETDVDESDDPAEEADDETEADQESEDDPSDESTDEDQ